MFDISIVTSASGSHDRRVSVRGREHPCQDGCMSLPQPLPRDARPHRSVTASVRTGMVWAVAASAINILIWLVATAFGVDFVLWPRGEQEPATAVGPLAIAGATLLAALLASVAVGLLGKVVRKVVRWVIVGGAILTATSLTGPWDQPAEVSTSTRIVLTLMHLVTGTAVTFGLARGIWTDDRAVRA